MDKIIIETKNNLSEEIRVKEILEKALAKYPYPVFTDRVIIEREVIPHSHPVLTIGVWPWINRFSDLTPIIFEIFIHEQFHWFLVKLDREGRWEKGLAYLKEHYQPLGDNYRPKEHNKDWIFWAELATCFNTMNYLRQVLGKDDYDSIYNRCKNRPYPKTEKFIEENFEKLRADLEKYGLAYNR